MRLVLFSLLFIAFACAGPTQEHDHSGHDHAEESETATNQENETSKGYAIGESVEDFTLPNIDDAKLTLSQYLADSAKGYIITFTCNHCPYAKAYEERLVALDKKYKPLGFPVVAINPNDPAKVPEDDFENMKKRAEEKGFTFPYLLDEAQTIFPKFGATKTPHVFVVEKAGAELKLRYIGAIDDNYEDPEAVEKRYVEDAVNALLNGQEVPVATTKAIGCSIKA